MKTLKANTLIRLLTCFWNTSKNTYPYMEDTHRKYFWLTFPLIYVTDQNCYTVKDNTIIFSGLELT